MAIRQATTEDIPRIAEILVFSKRKNYRYIFKNDVASFTELQVYPLAKNLFENPNLLKNVFVYDDEFVKGLIRIDGAEIKELYVDPFFERKGIGGNLLNYAISNYHVQELWVLDKNEKAKNFYLKHGFTETNQVREVPEAPGSKITERKMALDHLANH
ncbi:GNAT family N-acetyltransferase [Candidatus Saccharibacteria bacterium]|nr:GNAT family N-acetyltransferase [Candidatus Saccharibacteria bacterium]